MCEPEQVDYRSRCSGVENYREPLGGKWPPNIGATFPKGTIAMNRISLIVASLPLLFGGGCGPAGESAAPPVIAVDAARYLLPAEPADPQHVIAARTASQDQDAVVVVGRIGGSRNPWVQGRAAFSIVDCSLKACSDIPGDKCPVPWDYCCALDKLPTATALVKIVDEQGQLLRTDARQLLDLAELQTVVVRGTAQRDDAGNLTVLASRIFVRK